MPLAQQLKTVFCIPRLSGIGGHVASKNGLGAVMGSKNLKAVVAYRGKRNFEIKRSGTI